MSGKDAWGRRKRLIRAHRNSPISFNQRQFRQILIKSTAWLLTEGLLVRICFPQVEIGTRTFPGAERSVTTQSRGGGDVRGPPTGLRNLGSPENWRDAREARKDSTSG